MLTFIDERGRLFGKINLIDAMALAALALCVPLGYGAWALFRITPPTIVALDPARITTATEHRILVRGTHLRPYLNVHVGPVASLPLLVVSPELAEIHLPPLSPGVYDLTMFDEAQEVARRASALTVVAAPSVMTQTFVVTVIGTFLEVLERDMALIYRGARLTDHVTVLGVRASMLTPPDKHQIPALLNVSCAVVNGHRMFGDVEVAQNNIVLIKTPAVVLMFLIESVKMADSGSWS